MRSRYSAFTLGNEDYLLATWAPPTRPESLALDQSPRPKWLGLTIVRSVMDGDTGTVEFVARYKINGRATRLHETSRFIREAGRWLYLDGDLHDA